MGSAPPPPHPRAEGKELSAEDVALHAKQKDEAKKMKEAAAKLKK